MTAPDRDVDVNPACTARTSVGVSVVAITAIALAAVVVGWWFW